MTILSLALSILKGLQQVMTTQQQILATQQQQAANILDLKKLVDALAITQEHQEQLLEKILAAVEGGPSGVTAKIILGTPEPQ